MGKEKILKKHIQDAIVSVKNAIDRQPLENKMITVLAQEAGIDRNTLQQGFKLLFGRRMKGYMVLKRLEAGKELLLEDKMTRKQIASRCGYRSAPSFYTAFKKEFGLTPTEWMREQP